MNPIRETSWSMSVAPPDNPKQFEWYKDYPTILPAITDANTLADQGYNVTLDQYKN